MAGSSIKVSADGLADALNKILQETKELTDEAVQTSVDKTAKDVVAKTKGAAPVRTGEYKRGWRSKVTRRTGRGAYGRTVHNGPRYRLAHLLQNGHGGPRPARAIPHIPSDEETEAIFTKNLESEMVKG